MKILCVEDDVGLGQILKTTLVKQKYEVDLVKDGETGWEFAKNSSYDLIILDLIVPRINGIELCKLLRSHQSADTLHRRYIPIILMTAFDSLSNKVTGLDAGADDYIVKPINLEELLARIRALLRRYEHQIPELLTWGQLCLNSHTCEVFYGKQQIHLSKKEYEILVMFLRHPQQIFSHNLLLDSLWTEGEIPTQGALRAHIKALRNKLKQAGVNDILETVYKLGYRLRQPATTDEKNITLNQSISTRISPVTVSATQDIAPQMRDVWQKYRQSYQERLRIIEEVVNSLEEGIISQEQRTMATREVHTLIGSLGSFGLYQATEICRQIQSILQQEQGLEKIHIDHLQLLLKQLQPYLELDKSVPLIPNCIHRLLIIEGDIILAQQIVLEANNRNLKAEIKSDKEEILQILSDGVIDIILFDLDRKNEWKIELNFLTKIRREFPKIPIVILSESYSLTTRVEVARLGITSYLEKPINPNQVLLSLTQILQQINLPLYRLLVVDDDDGILQLIYKLLSPYGYQITLLDEPLKFWETLESTNPDLLILDVELSTVEAIDNTDKILVNGFDICQIIRSDWRWNRLPIVFLSAHTDAETIYRSFVVGANDFLNKPIVPSELQNRVRIRLEQQQIWRLTETDAVTGLNLRRKTVEDLTRLLQVAQRQRQPLSLAVLDLDFFKSVNDNYGHHTGDRVLNYLGQLLRQSFLPEDLLGRWGDKEFVVATYGVLGEASKERLTEVLQKFQQHLFTTNEGAGFRVTFSAGIAIFPHHGQDVQTLFQAADIALYNAKKQGRNLVLLAQTNDFH